MYIQYIMSELAKRTKKFKNTASLLSTFPPFPNTKKKNTTTVIQNEIFLKKRNCQTFKSYLKEKSEIKLKSTSHQTHFRKSNALSLSLSEEKPLQRSRCEKKKKKKTGLAANRFTKKKCFCF